jgi:hypothetical protein
MGLVIFDKKIKEYPRVITVLKDRKRITISRGAVEYLGLKQGNRIAFAKDPNTRIYYLIPYVDTGLRLNFAINNGKKTEKTLFVYNSYFAGSVLDGLKTTGSVTFLMANKPTVIDGMNCYQLILPK